MKIAFTRILVSREKTARKREQEQKILNYYEKEDLLNALEEVKKMLHEYPSEPRYLIAKAYILNAMDAEAGAIVAAHLASEATREKNLKQFCSILIADALATGFKTTKSYLDILPTIEMLEGINQVYNYPLQGAINLIFYYNLAISQAQLDGKPISVRTKNKLEEESKTMVLRSLKDMKKLAYGSDPRAQKRAHKFSNILRKNLQERLGDLSDKGFWNNMVFQLRELNSGPMEKQYFSHGSFMRTLFASMVLVAGIFVAGNLSDYHAKPGFAPTESMEIALSEPLAGGGAVMELSEVMC